MNQMIPDKSGRFPERPFYETEELEEECESIIESLLLSRYGQYAIPVPTAATGGSLAAVNLPASASGDAFNADNGMTGFNGAALTYDANGNLTSDGTNTYTWDARHHLTQITQKRTTVASFVYDALGRRMSKTVGGTVTQFMYDGLNPVEELDGASPPNVTANLLTGLGLDERFTRTDAAGAMAFMTDALGSTVGLVNSAGGIDTSYTYQPFGATTVNGTSANPYQFTGRENDGTGLYFNRARYYSPTFQRFISQDPISFRGGDTNLYAYAYGNPISVIDSLGFAGGAGPVQQGQAGVNQVLQGLSPNNTGTEITIDTPSGRTRLDIGSYDPESGELNLLEVKNGPGARLTPNQRACFPDIQNQNFTPAGQNASDLGLSLEPGGGVSSVNIDIVNLNGANVQMPEAAPPAAAAPVTEPVDPVGVPIKIPFGIDIF